MWATSLAPLALMFRQGVGGKFQCPTESNRSVDDNDKYFFIQSEHFED